ncbi:branched-chain amino acid ABC transporter [Liberibacter crescens BT-1]|uniref:Branched-chain amino acid ABC transporter n=1 Tax=Liberibacter crescens (strain BT-1) TaxID=1215343 RepID=L0EUM6_LIBCB|nr:ABC transporter substrate-binding protein [Liberibacter crescens]AGA64530.1 branched-chain amino acid ABC transporter [Liberibacter crescens BT-1]AMC12680.1 hypothetical protein RL73_02790 [Liberibacter crescens]
MNKFYRLLDLFSHILLIFYIFQNDALANNQIIGVVAPKNGQYAVLGKQIFQAAQLFSKQTGNKIIEIDETCTQDNGQKIVQPLVNANAIGAIGFLCSETLEGALPEMKKAHLPVLTVSVRSRALMEDALQNDWPFFRLAPSSEDESNYAVQMIILSWKGKKIALLEDGSLQGHELVTTIGNTLINQGIKPDVIEVFKPQQDQQVALIKKLVKANITHVFLASERSDVAIIAHDAARLKTKMTFMMGDAIRNKDDKMPLPAGILSVCLPDYSASSSAKEVMKIFNKASLHPTGYSLPTWAALQILVKANENAQKIGSKTESNIAKKTFQTVLGQVTFTAGHAMQENPFRLMLWDGKNLIERD